MAEARDEPAETEAEPTQAERSAAGSAEPEPSEADQRGPLTTSIALERTYRINGRRITVQALLPATVARAIGMEAAYEAARRIVLRVESKEATVEEVPVGGTPPKPARGQKKR